MISSSDSPLDRTWLALRAASRPALIPYLTAGFPSVNDSLAALQMTDAHADVIEVGVPFSDPLADGPTIQASTFRALANGMSLPRTLDLISRAALRSPVVLFSYCNPVLQYGVERLLADAAAIGVAGLLLTDLPAGADPAVERRVQDSPLDLIRLVAPTTAPARVAQAVAGGAGFIYLVARLGVTGVSQELAVGLDASVDRVRGATALPVAVGFGISTPAQARAVGRLADGVIVGSALIDVLGTQGVAAADRFLSGLRAAIEPQ